MDRCVLGWRDGTCAIPPWGQAQPDPRCGTGLSNSWLGREGT